MVPRSGRAPDRLLFLAPLVVLLLLSGTAAAPFSSQAAYREARAAADRNEVAGAMRMVDAALQHNVADDEWMQALRMLRGELLAKRGRAEEAMQLLKPELPPRFRTSEAAVRRLIALGIATGWDRARAQRFVEDALALAEKHQPKLRFAVHLALGTFAEPELHFTTALRLAQHDGNLVGVALARNALSRFYTSDGRLAEAVERGEKALATFDALKMPGRVATAAGNLGWAYMELGDTDRAKELFVRAERAAAAAGLDEEQTRWLNQLGNVSRRQYRYADAERFYRNALERKRALGVEKLADVLSNLARNAIDTGRLDDARTYIAEALKSATDDQYEQKLSSRTVEAQIAIASGDFARAENTLSDVARNATRDERRWAANALLADVYAHTGRNAAAEKAYRTSIDTLRGVRESIKDPQLRLSFFENATGIFDSYVAFLIRNGRSDDALVATELIRAQTLEEGLSLPAGSRTLDARAIARQRNAAILCYRLGRAQSHLWIVTPQSVNYVSLPPAATIERAAEAYRAALLTPRHGTLAASGARGAELYRMLIAPASLRLAKGARVIVIADGPLHALNFETLVVPDATPRYWINDVTLTSASSLQLLASADEAARTNGALLLVGDPPQVESFPRLPYASKEISEVAQHFAKRVVLAGPQATPASYRNAKPDRFEFIHFVAHGVSSRQRPLDSAVILGHDAAHDYKLAARDVLAHPLHARLVTISSCHGAGERTYAAEGLVGLAWAFLRAGASNVIAALWAVDDAATPQLMDQMYASIRAGRDPAVALREAKLAMVNGKGGYARPKYWAPFVLYEGR
ncbi:MAG: CHAT domain-containing protein [Acidobacteriota bacterium]|nr:CHAT domain-containing protein [Acidobacteriota bacterium]